MKLFFNIILLFVFSIFFCGGTCTPNSSSTQQSITFSTWGSQSEIKIIKEIIKDFEKDNNIKVNLIHIPQNYFQKLHLLFASNNAPDVLFINNYYLGLYQNANLLTDLTPYFSKEIKEKKYFENTIQSLSRNEKLYALPRDISNMVIYYNKDYFKKNKINLPREDWNYKDFLQLSKQLTTKNNWAIGYEENPLFWEPILWANGGSIYDKYGNLNINKKESLEALKFYMELNTKHKVMPQKQLTTNQTMAQMFLNKKIIMHISGRWLVPKYREEATFDWDVISLPKGKHGSVASSDSSGYAISESSRKKELAIKFIKYMNSNTSLKRITESGLITPAKKEIAYSNTYLNNEKPQNAKIFLKINYNAKINTIPRNYNQQIEKLKNLLEPYFLGEKTITQDTNFEL